MASYTSSTYPSIYPEIQAELLPGESVLWTGQPLRRVIFHTMDFYAVPFSILWGGFAIFWEWGVTDHFTSFGASSTAHSFLALWGIPFILLGQYLIWGRFLVIAWRKEGTFYAVTNRRVLVVTTGFSRKVLDGNLRTLPYAYVASRPDGVGTIKFIPAFNSTSQSSSVWIGASNDSTSDSRGEYPSIDINLSSLAFFDIPDVRAVYQLIQSKRDQA